VERGVFKAKKSLFRVADGGARDLDETEGPHRTERGLHEPGRAVLRRNNRRSFDSPLRRLAEDDNGFSVAPRGSAVLDDSG